MARLDYDALNSALRYPMITVHRRASILYRPRPRRPRAAAVDRYECA